MKAKDVDMILELLGLATSFLAGAPGMVTAIRAANAAIQNAHSAGRELTAADWNALDEAVTQARSELRIATGKR